MGCFLNKNQTKKNGNQPGFTFLTKERPPSKKRRVLGLERVASVACAPCGHRCLCIQDAARLVGSHYPIRCACSTPLNDFSGGVRRTLRRQAL